MPVGARIKGRRKEMGFTLQELAAASGLSAPFLSQVERDLTTPSLTSLVPLADALEVDMNFFMTIPHTADIVHRKNAPRIIEADSPVTYYDLSSDLLERKLDIIVLHIPPGFAFPVDQRNGELFRYVLEGEVVATAGDVETVLRAGDSMHFDTRLKHHVANHSEKVAILLTVGTPSLFHLRDQQSSEMLERGDIVSPEERSRLKGLGPKVDQS